MASDGMEDALIAEAGKSGSDADKKKKFKLILIGLAVIVAVYAYNVINSRPPVDNAGGPAAAPGAQEAGVPEGATESAEQDPAAGKGLDIEKGDQRAYVIEFDKRLTQLSLALNKQNEENSKLKQSIENRLVEMQNDLDKKLGVLVEEQTQAIQDKQRDIRYGPGGLPAPSGAAGGIPGEPKPASKIEYVAFAAPQTKSDVKFQPFTDAKESVSVDDKLQRPETKPIGSQAREEADRKAKEAKKKIAVPAAAWANITLLHGVDCPVGENLAVPIVLPIMSAIRGPNGDIVDLGNAHLQGKCVGQANTERGRIVVEKISYVGADGKQQFIAAEGYVVDRRDSGQDVKGYYDSKQGQALAKAALANAIAALGKLSVLQESTTTVNTTTGGATSTLTGDIGRAAIGAAISGAADRTSQYYQAQIERLIPIVHLEPALPLNFVSTKPFEVDDPTEMLIDDRL